MAEAQALFDEGIRLFNLGRYREACPKFEDSLSLVAGVGTRGKLAECYEQQGKTASAWRLYKEVERLATRSGNDLRRQVAAERVRALEPRLARLTVQPGPAVVLPGFSIAVNAQPLPPREYGMTRIVDPGNYIIVARAPGYRPWVQSVRLREGGQDSVNVRALEAARTSRARAASYAFIGMGALTAVGGGAYFGTRARSQWDSAFEDGHCDRQTLECDGVGLERSRLARRDANLANLAVAVGALSAAVGVVLFVRSRSEQHPGTATSARIQPALQPDGLSVAVVGWF